MVAYKNTRAYFQDGLELEKLHISRIIFEKY